MTTVTITVNDIGESPTAPTARATTLQVTENMEGDDVSVLDSSDPQGDSITFQVDDDRFEVTDQGVLKLKDGMSLDHETEESVDLVLTATDEFGHVSNETMITVSVVDVNEAPTVHEMYAPEDVMDGVADMAIVIEDIYLESLFSDQDDTDSLFTYTLADAPDGWNMSMTTQTVTHTVTAPTVNAVEYEYTPPMMEEEEGDTNGDDGMSGDMHGDDGDAMPTDIGAISFTDPDTDAAMGRGDEHTFSVYDDRFQITEGGMLQLKAGMVLEEDTEVMVRVTDSYGLSGTGTITITIASDGDEEGDGDGAGDGDGQDMPEPETRDVTFITGTITGTPPAGTFGEWTVAVVATDDGGASARAEFDIVVDDGNDLPTTIHLTNSDGTNNALYQVEIDENDDGVSLGTLTVEDIDSPDHPHGQHKWTVNHPKFEVTDAGVLKLKNDMSLDYETDGASFVIEVTATDMMGESGGLSSDPQPITVTVNNLNDRPKAADEIGNWWVVVPEDLDADDAGPGEWLSFALETMGDDNPAFTDQDVGNADGDKLTYSITSGPSWLEIEPTGMNAGTLTNKAGTKASPGKYYVTVRATDEGQNRDEDENTDGAYDEITFMIIVAESDDNNEDNHEPEVTVNVDQQRRLRRRLRQAGRGPVTVVDDDFALAPHPYGQLANNGKPELVNADLDNDGSPDATGDAGMFELSETYTQNGNARTWTVYTKANQQLDHETEDDIEITVRAWNELDGTVGYSRRRRRFGRHQDRCPGRQRSARIRVSGESGQLRC